MRGRTVRCARCGHKWHQLAAEDADLLALEMEPSDAPAMAFEPAAAGPGDFGDTQLAAEPVDLQAIPGGLDLGAIDFGETPEEGPAKGDAGEEDEEDPLAKISELMMMSSTPEPIPDVFASAPPRPAVRRKGAAGLALLGAIVLIGGSGVALYVLQDRVVDLWPPAAGYYEMLGVRNEVVGAGLNFRNYNSERLVQDANEVLIVRGVIANTTDQTRDVPLLRLALYNNDKLLQEKIISPPQTGLEPRGSVGFKITLDQPDPNASRFEVTFTAAKPPVKDAQPKESPAVKDALPKDLPPKAP